MNEHKASFPDRHELREYTLFLDRDGVVNKPLPDDYVKTPDAFHFTDGALDALRKLKDCFKYVVLVTNQQGIDRNLMSERDLEDVHLKMFEGMSEAEVPYFDLVCFAPYLRAANHPWRKPGTGMADYAMQILDIDPKKIVMCGDSPGDMEMGRNLRAFTVHIQNPQFELPPADLYMASLSAFAHFITQN